EIAVDLVLERADRVRVVRPDDLRVPPGRRLQRCGDDVLRRVVEERRAGVLLDGARRPRRLEHLVGGASEQDPARRSGDRGDRLSHLRVEAVLERPGRRVDDAVEAHELVYVYCAHVAPPCRCCRVDVSTPLESSTTLSRTSQFMCQPPSAIAASTASCETL